MLSRFCYHVRHKRLTDIYRRIGAHHLVSSFSTCSHHQPVSLLALFCSTGLVPRFSFSSFSFRLRGSAFVHSLCSGSNHYKRVFLILLLLINRPVFPQLSRFTVKSKWLPLTSLSELRSLSFYLLQLMQSPSSKEIPNKSSKPSMSMSTITSALKAWQAALVLTAPEPVVLSAMWLVLLLAPLMLLRLRWSHRRPLQVLALPQHLKAFSSVSHMSPKL